MPSNRTSRCPLGNKSSSNQRCMRSVVSSGAVVFIGGGCPHRISKREMFFLVKRCAAVEGMLVAWWRDEFG